MYICIYIKKKENATHNHATLKLKEEEEVEEVEEEREEGWW